jgi:hypothetical protein
MRLYSVEYQINRTGQVFTCKSVGVNEQDIVNDISSVVGGITVLSIHYVSEVHRISDQIRKQIVEHSINKNTTVKKIGRPRKYEIFGE